MRKAEDILVEHELDYTGPKSRTAACTCGFRGSSDEANRHAVRVGLCPKCWGSGEASVGPGCCYECGGGGTDRAADQKFFIEELRDFGPEKSDDDGRPEVYVTIAVGDGEDLEIECVDPVQAKYTVMYREWTDAHELVTEDKVFTGFIGQVPVRVQSWIADRVAREERAAGHSVVRKR